MIPFRTCEQEDPRSDSVIARCWSRISYEPARAGKRLWLLGKDLEVLIPGDQGLYTGMIAGVSVETVGARKACKQPLLVDILLEDKLDATRHTLVQHLRVLACKRHYRRSVTL